MKKLNRQITQHDQTKAFNEAIEKRMLINEHEIICFVLSGVCCNSLLMAGIDEELQVIKRTNGKPLINDKGEKCKKLMPIKGKKGKDIREFLKYAKELHNVVDSQIVKAESPQDLDTAGDDFTDDIQEDSDALDLLWFVTNQLHTLNGKAHDSVVKSIANVRKAIKRFHNVDIVRGKYLFDGINNNRLANGLSVSVKDDNKTQD